MNFATVGMQGDRYVIIAARLGTYPQDEMSVTKAQAEIIRNYLCVYLGMPTVEELAEL